MKRRFAHSIHLCLRILVCLCIGMTACSTGDLDRDEARPATAAAFTPAVAIEAAARITVEQTHGRVVMSDAVRRARAFENGLVGQKRRAPEPVAPDVPRPSARAIAQADICDLPPGEPCDPPPPVPAVNAQTIATDTIRVTYTCGAQAQRLFRTSPVFAELPIDCFADATSDTGLTPGTTYCYAIANDDGTLATAAFCATTLWEPFLFDGPGLTQAESDQMAAAFDWTHTDPVAVTIPSGDGPQPALYSMNILVKNAEDLVAIRGLGIHTQTQPLLPDEQAAWDGQVMTAMSEGRPAGVWITAVVPGPVYNDLRGQAIAGIASGAPIGIKAMVFRRINMPDAAVFPNNTVVSVSPLAPTFLGREGLEFNGFSAVECDPGPPATCTIQQSLLGWVARIFITVVVEIVVAVVDAVRQVFGRIQRLVLGEVDVTVQFVLKNTDDRFGFLELTRSGWNAGNPLALKNVRVRAYQGVAQFTGTTDENGVATVTVAKNRSGKVCVDLDNAHLEVIDFFTTRRVCLGSFSATSVPITVAIETTEKHANLLAAITDAADYVQTVLGFEMPKISVLTGWQSSLVTFFSQGRSFTPCQGRMPNLIANIALHGTANALIALLGEIAEFATSYDIVMADDDVRSRGVAIHEYGHAVMCELLREVNRVKAAAVWAEIMVTTNKQTPTMEPQVIGEGFADFIALQVVGATSYARGNRSVGSRGMNYCNDNGATETDCFEANFERCDGGSPCTFDFETNVRWVVSLLQDAFDRIPADAAERANPPVELPNDGSHWRLDNNALLASHASLQVSATDSDTLQLEGPGMSNVFSGWGSLGSVLRYRSFFGGLVLALKAQGFEFEEVCAMFAAHEPSHVCPGYVIETFGTRFAYALADQPTETTYEPTGTYAHNGANGGIVIGRSGPGQYQVFFENLPAWSADLSASVAVTAHGSSAITCSVANFEAVNDSTLVDVSCWNHALNAAADSPFTILVMGNSSMPPPSAFLSSGGPAPVPPPSPLTSWTSGSHPMTVTHNGASGEYDVNLGVGNAPLSAKLVTAAGPAGGERCNQTGAISGGLTVKCYDRSGAPSDGLFHTLQVAGGRLGKRFGFAFANLSNSPSYTPLSTTAFNSSGGPITITRSAPGRYAIEFAGLQKEEGHTENVQVTAISGILVTCNVVNWLNSDDGLAVHVECRNGTGQFVDSRYEVMVIE